MERIVATLSGEPVSAQTVSKLIRELDAAVEQFHRAPLKDEWVYLLLDGVSLRVRRPAGTKRVQMLVAYPVRRTRRPSNGRGTWPRAARCSKLLPSAGGRTTRLWCGCWNGICRCC